jgi:CheY-like chemotaxis protein
LRNLRILVLDDGLIAAQLAVTIAEAGHEVIGPVTSGDEAMELAVQKKPNLAFLNINQPQPAIVHRFDELGIPTMFLIGSISAEAGASPAGLLFDPHFLNKLLAIVEYVQYGAGISPAAVRES